MSKDNLGRQESEAKTTSFLSRREQRCLSGLTSLTQLSAYLLGRRAKRWWRPPQLSGSEPRRFTDGAQVLLHQPLLDAVGMEIVATFQRS